MIVINICPACLEPLSSWPCGNESCNCDKGRFRSLVILSKEDGGIIACPFCGFKECHSFWEVQNIELFIATQEAKGLSEASDLYDKRRIFRVE